MPSPLTPPGVLVARDDLDLDLRARRAAARSRGPAHRRRARHAGDNSGAGLVRAGKCGKQSAFDLLAHQAGIDDAPRIDRGDQPRDLDPLVGADARLGQQSDVRAKSEAQASPMVLPGAPPSQPPIAAAVMIARASRGAPPSRPMRKAERLRAAAPAPSRR